MSQSAENPGGASRTASGEERIVVVDDGRDDTNTNRQRLDLARALEALGATSESSGSRSVSDIVSRAANVLEEELASGIDAARRVEERFVDVERIREKDQEELIQRFRRDAHDIVDILIDLLDVVALSASGTAQRVVSIRRSTGEGPPANAGGVSMLEVPGVVAPGATATLSMMVQNDGGDEIEHIELVASDLVSPSGGLIPAANVDLEPSKVELGANERRRVSVEVTVPEGASAGVYAGLVQATNFDQVRALLSFRVGQ